MKYEMQVYVTVYADSVYAANRIVKAQVEKCGFGCQKSALTYIDSMDVKAEPECGDCGAVLADATLPDYALCESCRKAAADVDAKESA